MPVPSIQVNPFQNKRVQTNLVNIRSNISGETFLPITKKYIPPVTISPTLFDVLQINENMDMVE